MSGLIAVCVRAERNELVQAECQNLTGGIPDADGLAPCQTLEYIRQAAYVRAGVRLIARGKTLAELVQEVARQQFEAEDFCIELARFNEQFNEDHWRTITAVANAIQAMPDLEHPRHRFLLAVVQDGLWFGEIAVETDQSYTRHDQKPWRTSSSLPSRLARAMVNLVSPPARSILDPLCGTGSILLEAQSIGLEATGVDWNTRMVGMTRQNLAHFGYTAEVLQANALEIDRCADAVVTDLPYGKFLQKDDGVVRSILEHCARLAQVGIFAAGEDITPWLIEAGYQQAEVFEIQHRANFSRFIHRARSDG